MDMQSIDVKKYHFFNKKVKKPLEKCVSGAARGAKRGYAKHLCAVKAGSYHFFNKKVKNPLEKCVSGATKGVLHYVFRRKWSILTKNGNF